MVVCHFVAWRIGDSICFRNFFCLQMLACMIHIDFSMLSIPVVACCLGMSYWYIISSFVPYLYILTYFFSFINVIRWRIVYINCLLTELSSVWECYELLTLCASMIYRQAVSGVLEFLLRCFMVHMFSISQMFTCCFGCLGSTCSCSFILRLRKYMYQSFRHFSLRQFFYYRFTP